MALDTALGTPHTLPGDAPQQALALIAVRRRGGRPEDKVVRRCTADRIDERLQRLLVDVHFLWADKRRTACRSAPTHELASKPRAGGVRVRKNNTSPTHAKRKFIS